ncbi:class F sortase [Actinomadura rugatobispora]|uniref:Class F sortase n=1 Tax=Actinomadura rugatobispora TaxID=1994 RepID=A0ABW1A4X6_9ACTN|nr:class F sortase [Actinomadura rugatobispora]
MPGYPASAAGRRAACAAAGALLTTLLTTLLAGCGGGENTAAPTPGPSSSTVPAANTAPLPESPPTKITIPAIKVSAPVDRLGLRPDGRIEEPPLSRPGLTGWYKEGPTPGEVGPSVVLGHVDANGKAAVFARLKDLKPGDRIQVTRQDGSTATFAVERSERVDKNAFPHKKVFGADLDHAALRLVTCGGAFDQASGHYKDNLIVYTRLVTT